MANTTRRQRCRTRRVARTGARRRFQEQVRQECTSGDSAMPMQENPSSAFGRSGRGGGETAARVSEIETRIDLSWHSSHPGVPIGGQHAGNGHRTPDRNSGIAVKQSMVDEMIWDEPDDLFERERTPSVEVADVFRQFGPAYRQRTGAALSVQEDRVLRELSVCRTAVLGGRLWQCGGCGERMEQLNSCGNRSCPKCQGRQRRAWAAHMQSTMLPVEYWHVILTVPGDLSQLAIANPNILYSMMLRTGGRAIIEAGERWEPFGARMGVSAILHSFGQILNNHLHSHNMVPGGGLSADGTRWVGLSPGEFLPEERLRATFRDSFLKQLAKVYAKTGLFFPGELQKFASPRAFEAWLEFLRAIDWVIRMRCIPHSNEMATGGDDPLQKTIRYLARYTNRVAIGNHRLIAIEGDDVLFRYKDYRDADQWKTKRMPGVEFIEKFMRHVLPPGMQHIRHYGFLGNKHRKETLQQIREVIQRQRAGGVGDGTGIQAPGPMAEPEVTAEEPEEEAGRVCRHCGKGPMDVIHEIERPTVMDLLLMPLSLLDAPYTLEPPEPIEVPKRPDVAQKPVRPPEQLLLPIELPPCYEFW